MKYDSIAIIPARGGSKRIPRKNIKHFLGVPIIEHTIKTLQAGNQFDRIYVSTDDEEIAEVARNAGADIPFYRTPELANDLTPTAPVIQDMLVRLKILEGIETELCCCIYPCNPLLNNELIARAKKRLQNGHSDFVYPVCTYPHPIQRSMRMDKLGKMAFRYPEFELTPTQEFEDFYHDAGQFYFGTSEAWISGKRMHTDGSGIKIPSHKVVDIDTFEDWDRAELIYKTLKNERLRQP